MSVMSDLHVKKCESMASRIMRLSESEQRMLIFEYFGGPGDEEDTMTRELAYDIARQIVNGRFHSRYFAKNAAS